MLVNGIDDNSPWDLQDAMKIRPTLHLLFVLLVLLGLGACESEHPLKVGSNQWPGYEPVYLARDLGLLSADHVKLVELPSTTEVMQYLRNGSLDAGMLTLDEAITLAQGGIDLQIVLIMDISDGADSMLAQPGISSLKEIKGRRVGVEIGAVGTVMLEAALKTAQLSLDDIELVNLTADQHATAFRNRQVDALITFEPTRSQLLSEGAVELFNSRHLPGTIVDVLAIRRDALGHHSDHVKQLLKAYFAARKRMQSAPQDAYERMTPRLGVKPSLLRTMFAGLELPTLEQNRTWLSQTGPMNKQVHELALLMKQWSLIKTLPDPRPLTSPDFLPKP